MAKRKGGVELDFCDRECDRGSAWVSGLRLRLRLVIGLLMRMEAELAQFFSHGQPRNASPTRGARLVPMCQFDGAAEQFLFGGQQEPGASVPHFSSLGSRQEFL